MFLFVDAVPAAVGPVPFVEEVCFSAGACFRIFLIALFQLSKFAILKVLMICFQHKIYFNLGELGRFLIDHYEVAVTAQNMAAVNAVLKSVALKVPSGTSTRQKGKWRIPRFSRTIRSTLTSGLL